ncbi:hypothetical protein K493DRAFT_260919 [Basidiobolus meristosporus CBS 931.73]|uniref:Uncharacterized protein n=1 Tax=Basidiobolus meristosporus CBS 931.73 TaxID=1314790 RepID=A0A1Y1YAL6_9FUNG|nr:hypothetical protein K493DRAFT_260919 [Basidiobolus meristosporus CBS 931.73]|eukprot:ORX94972.1 hypothetical protein K493DRAFT_260919 [Basidiobolus meristosporus CBS 931.73]
MTNEKDCTAKAVESALFGGTLGLLASAVQNSFQSHSAGAAGVFTRTGRVIPYLAVVGGVFSATECLSESIREKKDYINSGIAGCTVGILAGLQARSFPVMVGATVGLGVFMGLYDYTGGTLKGIYFGKSEEDVKQYREEFFKKNEKSA